MFLLSLHQNCELSKCAIQKLSTAEKAASTDIHQKTVDDQHVDERYSDDVYR